MSAPRRRKTASEKRRDEFDRMMLATALALEWIRVPGAQSEIRALGNGFAAAIRAAAAAIDPATGLAYAETHQERQDRKVAALRRLYFTDEISLLSFELELAHLPGGLPEA